LKHDLNVNEDVSGRFRFTGGWMEMLLGCETIEAKIAKNVY